MELYVIRRRGIWSSEDELAATNEKSLQVGEEMKDRLRWIRSYAVAEDVHSFSTAPVTSVVRK